MEKTPNRIKTMRLSNDLFMQSNGYKPAPLDLASIVLTAKLEELIDQLAENTHNLWAKERIQQGWTYGLNEVTSNPLFFYDNFHLLRTVRICIYIVTWKASMAFIVSYNEQSIIL